MKSKVTGQMKNETLLLKVGFELDIAWIKEEFQQLAWY
jgi:hypothetical protein